MEDQYLPTKKQSKTFAGCAEAILFVHQAQLFVSSQACQGLWLFASGLFEVKPFFLLRLDVIDVVLVLVVGADAVGVLGSHRALAGILVVDADMWDSPGVGNAQHSVRMGLRVSKDHILGSLGMPVDKLDILFGLGLDVPVELDMGVHVIGALGAQDVL